MAVHAHILLLLLLSWTPSTLSAGPRFAAVDNSNVPSSLDIAPLGYGEGKPAILTIQESPNNNIFERQEPNNGTCPSGNHTCYEIDAPNLCCDNDRYCYWNSDWIASCCSIGNKCEDSQCDADHFLVNTTSAITTAPTGTESASETPIIVVTYTTYLGCQNRPCDPSSFLCQPLFGMQCCENGQHCATGGNCIIQDEPTTSVSTIVTPVPSGCTTGQFRCAETDGGICCDYGSVCAWSTVGQTASVALCSPSSLPDDGSGSLSSRAKAGIGVGVVVVAAIVIGLVTWFCLRQRKRKSGQTQTNGTRPEMEQEGFSPGISGTTAPGGVRASYAATPYSPWGVRSTAFSDDTEATISSGRPPLHEHGRVYDYFGPDAVPGPYTTRDGEDRGPTPGNPITPPMSDGSSRIAGTPYNPDYIVRPVEIGGNEARREYKDTGKIDSERVASDHEEEPEQGHQTGLYELAGSPGHNISPLGSDVVSPMEKGPSPLPGGGGERK
ncbi:hypothetical protein F5Y18DRAFT_396989 [Xylariaceae sp. FL1019]|nr:hypothetical protein F5Y18DRAFT_396989 [Xylariaceae sp. FL1019]